jgi:tetratricopeptide (TPR) repeat protein
LTEQLPGNLPTGPAVGTPPPRTGFETSIDTDGLASSRRAADDMPQTISFDTVVDTSHYPPPSQQTTPPPFAPRATQQSSNPFNPHESAPTSMLAPQPTMNLSATVADNKADDISAKGTRHITDQGAGTLPTANDADPLSYRPPSNSLPPAAHPGPISSSYSSSPFTPDSGSASLPPPSAGTSAGLPPQPRLITPSNVGTSRPPDPPPAMPPRQGGLRAWHIGLGAFALLLLAGAAVGVFFAARKFLPQSNGTPPVTPTPVVVAVGKSADSLFNEADTLMASGDIAGALARLREAVALDPANAEAQRRLGDALIKNGSRAEAIDAYRAAAAANPQDSTLWQALASAQYDEGHFAEAVQSYQQYVALKAGSPGEDVELSLADALRGAGQADQAKAAYQKLSASSNPDIAQMAKERLTELAGPQAQLTPVAEATRMARNKPTPAPTAQVIAAVPTGEMSRPTVAPTQPPAPPPPAPQATTPAEHYRRGVDWWGSNRAAAVREFLAAQGNPDAAYYLGLNLAEGRDPSTLGRAQLVSALYYFQVAARGSHAAQARRYADQLGKEYDRRQGGK